MLRRRRGSPGNTPIPEESLENAATSSSECFFGNKLRTYLRLRTGKCVHRFSALLALVPRTPHVEAAHLVCSETLILYT